MPDINHAVLIGAPPEIVYRSITEEEGLSGWWTPGASATPVLNSIARFPFGNDYFKEMRLVALEPNRLVTWYCIHADDQWIDTTISFTLINGNNNFILENHAEMRGQVEQQQTANGTLLVFKHENWRSETLMFAECSYTWALFLKSLKSYNETGMGQPWPTQHMVPGGSYNRLRGNLPG